MICVIIFCVGLLGCANDLTNKFIDNSEIDNFSSNDMTENVNTTDYDQYTDNQQTIDVYMAILQNDVKFFRIVNYANGNWQDVEEIQGEYTYLHDCLYYDEYSDYIFEVEQFTVLDIDGDGLMEVVLSIGPIEERLVLYYDNDIVYGYWFSYRGMNDLKKDGTFRSSGGMMNWSINKLNFSFKICERKELCSIDSNYDDNGNYNISYHINGKEVSEIIWSSYCHEWNQKEDVAWYEFNEETISDDLVMAWNRQRIRRCGPAAETRGEGTGERYGKSDEIRVHIRCGGKHAYGSEEG